jgi:hypothetical protein
MKLQSLDRPWSAAVASPVRVCFVAAPAFQAAYGVVRLVGQAQGRYGPGLAWTAGHLLFLAGLVLFAPVLVGLYRLVPATSRARRLAALVTLAVAGVGLLLFVRVALIDLVVGLRAADHQAMDQLYGQIGDFPGLLPAVFYSLGPLLFEVGLAALLVQLAVLRPRRLPWWSPVLFLAGLVMISIDLDLLPVGAALFALALAPAAWRPRVRDLGGDANLH